MPRIAIQLSQYAKQAELLQLLQERGYHLIPFTEHTPPSADLALLDFTNRSAAEALPTFDSDNWLGLPVLVLADSQAISSKQLTIAAWLTHPFEPLEIVGAVRVVLDAHTGLNSQHDLAMLRAQLAATERERDEYGSADLKKDEFISYIAHELKNPMASIKGYSDLLRRRLNKTPDDPNRKGLEIISAQVGRMTLLLDQLLDFSRINMNRLQLDLRPVDFVQLAERLLEESQPMTDRHALQLVADTRPLFVLGDENRLRQAMHYVLGNAIKFSPAPGTIVVTLTADDQHASVAISDRGLGIPVNDQQRIFERFERGSNVDEGIGGMGLGLFLANELIARHNGTIAVSSASGEGSTFTLTLPLA